jgi:hypothetical protein
MRFRFGNYAFLLKYGTCEPSPGTEPVKQADEAAANKAALLGAAVRYGAEAAQGGPARQGTP